MARRRNRQGRGQMRKPTAAELGITAADVAAELVKALNLPPGATATPITTPNARSPWGAAMSMNGGTIGGGSQGYGGQLAHPLAPGGWTDPLVPFGPSRPIMPAAIDPLEEHGRPLPRRWQYPVSWNLPGNGDRFVPWGVLRGMADGVGIIRKCIEIRKAQMVQLEWDVVVDASVFEEAMLEATVSGPSKARAKAAAMGDPQARAEQIRANQVSRHQIEAEFRAKNAMHIAHLKDWWKKPDRINDWTFEDWLNAVMEEALVLDALALYPHQDMKGDLHSLEVIDGSTIKALLDHRGSTPQPPNPAFQQILYGFPRGEFTYTAEAQGTSDWSRDALIYKPRNRRAFSPYGFGPTEQAIFDSDLYLKRRAWMLSEYDDGVAPELLIKVDAPMTAQQLRNYETVFNDVLSGNTSERHRAKFLPAGFDPQLLPSLEERYKADYDLFLIRLIGLAFDVMPTELGFPPMGGLGGKGMSDGEENSQYRKSIRPTATWLTGMINEVSSTWLDLPPGLTFQFLGLEAEDEAAAMTVMEMLASKGGITINEMRDRQGLPRFDLDEADEPMIITGRDVIPLSGAIERSNAIAAGKAGGNQPGQPGQPQDGKDAPSLQGGKDQGGKDAQQQDAKGGKDAQPPAKPANAAKEASPERGVAGLAVLAQDTGRVLMLQRALVDDDPAAGSWEFPGGHLEPGETSLQGAQREWAEEVGVPVPDGVLSSTWTAGRYTGHLWTVPGEDSVVINADLDERHILNPDDPDGDMVEVVAWWDPDQLPGNPAVRRELQQSMPLLQGALATASDAASVAKASEAAAFRGFVRHLRKDTGRAFRPFEFAHHPGYIGSAANDLASAGEYAAATAVLDVVIT